MGPKPKAGRVLRSAQEALPNVLFDTLEVRYRRLRNSWKSSSGSTRRLPAYGGIVRVGVSLATTTRESRWKHSRQRPQPRQQACSAGAQALNEHADWWPSFRESVAAASGACCFSEQHAHLCHLGFLHRASVSGQLSRGSNAFRD